MTILLVLMKIERRREETNLAKNHGSRIPFDPFDIVRVAARRFFDQTGAICG